MAVHVHQSPVVFNLLRTLIQLLRKQLWQSFVSTVSSGSDLWEFHTFAFGVLVCFVSLIPLCLPMASQSHFPPFPPSLPVLTLTPVLASLILQIPLVIVQTMLTRRSTASLRQFHLNRWERRPTNESHMRLILILLAEWDCLSWMYCWGCLPITSTAYKTHHFKGSVLCCSQWWCDVVVVWWCGV